MRGRVIRAVAAFLMVAPLLLAPTAALAGVPVSPAAYEGGTLGDGTTYRLWTPGQPAVGQPVLLIWVHPAGGNEQVTPNYSFWPYFNEALANGWYVAASSMGGDSWGNAAAQASLLGLYNFAAARLGTAPKVILLGASMGGGAAATAIQKATLPAGVVKAVYFVDAVFDLYSMYKTSSYGRSIDRAYAANVGTLSSAASAGATSISSSVSIASGTQVAIDPTGTNPELVTTSGAPTGSDPYTIPVPALGFAHSSGAKVSDAPSRWAAFNPMGLSVDSFKGLPVRFTASTSDVTVLESENSVPFKALLDALSPPPAEDALLPHLGLHLGAGANNPADFMAFLKRNGF